MKQKIYEGR